MRFTVTMAAVLTTLSAAHAAALVPRALGKANEYPELNCLNAKGTNTPSFGHTPACGCVTMDTTTKSVYIATSPGQSVTAFATSNCAAGIQHESLLGNVGGNCHSLDTQFNLAPVRSLYFWIPIICDIGDIIESLPAEAADFVKDIVEGVALA